MLSAQTDVPADEKLDKAGFERLKATVGMGKAIVVK